MKKRLVALLCLLAAPVSATVIVDSQTAAGIANTVGYSQWNMTIGSGINRAIVVGCETNIIPPLAISSMTVAGSTMSLVGTTFNGLDRAELWIGTAPTSGANTVRVNFFANPGYTDAVVLCGAISFENVNQTSAVDVSTGSVNKSSVTWTTTVSTTMLVDVIGQGTTSYVPTAGTGQTLLWSVANQSRFTSTAGSTKEGGAAGSKYMEWTIESNNAMQALALKSATGAPDLTTISPATKGVGQGQFTLTVNGQDFVSGATVTWNGYNRATTFVNSTQVTAVILSTDAVTIGLFPVRVINPDTARSNIVYFDLTGDITKVWATDGGYKPDQNTLYGTLNSTTVAATRIWNGTTVMPFQAKNEVNGFALVLENNTVIDATVTVSYPALTGPNGYVISSTPATTSTLWDWRNRPIQLYYVRYLPINGMSMINWDSYDEYHVPERFQATCTPSGGLCSRTGGFSTRPDRNKYYPDILVPMEAVVGSTFTVRAASSQIVWVDIYVPKNAPAGTYTGSINIYEGVTLSTTIPISLMVYPFTMPDVPPSEPYAYLSIPNINFRQSGMAYPNYGGINSSHTVTRMHYYQELWRHGVTPIGDAEQGGCEELIQTGPCPEYQIQLDGTLFSPTSGYANAPGVQTGVPVYSMFTYGNWRATSYWPYTSSATCTNANIWTQWFQNHAPKADYFWYMEDEPTDITGTSAIWSTWISTCPAPGNLLSPFTTIAPEDVYPTYPNIKHIATTQALGIASVEDTAVRSFLTAGNKQIDYYNGYRPFTGSMLTEDDGVAMRVMGWTQFKKKFDHWFIWETTNYESGGQQNHLFSDAKTFGYFTSTSAVFGTTGSQYQNGDGVLLYPGTDYVITTESYGADVPFPSYRLKMWRRGINDHTYLTMASQYDPRAVNAIVQQIIPKVIWEYGVVDTADPTYQYGPKSWSSDPDVWERARERLAQIISSHR